MEEKSFEDQYTPRVEIDWDRSFWWWYPITRAIHPAMRLTALATSAVALLVLQFGMAVGQWTFAPRFASGFDDWSLRSLTRVPLAPIETGQSQLFVALGFREIAYLTFCLIWLTALFGFFGGMLSRRAAVELGQRTIAPWWETLKIVGSRMVSYLWVTGMQLVAIAALLFVPWLLGMIARLGPMAYLAGLILLLLFPIAILVGRLVVSMFICYPLAVTAISCEKNADAFEGFSRSNNYFFQRPVVTTLCAVALIGIGFVGYEIVYWILLAGWHWMRDAFLSGAGYSVSDFIAKPAEGSGSPTDMVQASRLTGWLVAGGWLTRLLIHAYVFSFFWSACAAIYLILRRSVDNTDMDEIDTLITGAAVDLPEIPLPPAEIAKPDLETESHSSSS